MKLPLIICCIIYFLNPITAQEDPCEYKPEISKPDTSPLVVKKKPGNLIYDNAISFLALSDPGKSKSFICKMQFSSTVNFLYRNASKGLINEFSLYDETALTPDSIIENQKDLSRLKWSFQSASENNSHWRQSSSLLVQTQKLPVRKEISGSHIPERRMESTFLSPGIILFSIGITREFAGNGKVECGLAGGKLTWIDRKNLYETNNLLVISGVEKGKSFLLEGGFSMQASLKKNFNKFIRWENTTIIFADISAATQPDIEFRNGFFWDDGKLLRTTLRTVYTYDRKRWPPSSWTGELALGLYLARN